MGLCPIDTPSARNASMTSRATQSRWATIRCSRKRKLSLLIKICKQVKYYIFVKYFPTIFSKFFVRFQCNQKGSIQRDEKRPLRTRAVRSVHGLRPQAAPDLRAAPRLDMASGLLL